MKTVLLTILAVISFQLYHSVSLHTETSNNHLFLNEGGYLAVHAFYLNHPYYKYDQYELLSKNNRDDLVPVNTGFYNDILPVKSKIEIRNLCTFNPVLLFTNPEIPPIHPATSVIRVPIFLLDRVFRL